MGERGATGGAWGARDDASWWPSSAGELQHQQQLNEEIGTSTATTSQQMYSYKMSGGFTSNGNNTTPSYEYRIMSNSNTREASPRQQWWYSSGGVDSQQASSPTVRTFNRKYILIIMFQINFSIVVGIKRCHSGL